VLVVGGRADILSDPRPYPVRTDHQPPAFGQLAATPAAGGNPDHSIFFPDQVVDRRGLPELAPGFDGRLNEELIQDDAAGTQ
jgi:hypothetical protein